MTSFLQLTLALAILIAAAKAGGYLSYRLGQPAVLGELLVGILLGPTLVNILHLPYFSDEHLPEVINELAEIGVMMLMFLAGLELHLSDLAQSGKVSALAGVLGVLLPLGMGLGAGLLLKMPMEEALFLGLILAATSVSISAQTLMELKVLRSRVGIGLLGAAVLDDILVILLVSVFSALILPSDSSGWGGIILVVVRMALFLVLATAIGMVALPWLSQRVHALGISQGLLAFVLVIMFLYGWAAEEWGGMAAITGAFLAGLLLARSPLKERIENGMVALAYGLFVPIFFINVGLSVNGRQLAGPIFWTFVIMTLVAVIGKVFGAGLGGLLAGFTRRESLQLGIGMMSRGEVGLIVATLALKQELITQEIFAAVVGVVIVTTLLTPPLLRYSFRGENL
jgi:Kef-type K+ transport system membrane component KefB